MCNDRDNTRDSEQYVSMNSRSVDRRMYSLTTKLNFLQFLCSISGHEDELPKNSNTVRVEFLMGHKVLRFHEKESIVKLNKRYTSTHVIPSLLCTRDVEDRCVMTGLLNFAPAKWECFANC